MDEYIKDSTKENIDTYKNNIYDHIDLLEIKKLLIKLSSIVYNV